MQNLGRKGFSPIIQITILSALSVISLMLIWGYVADLSTGLGEQLSPAVDCINQQSRVVSACLNEGGKVEVTLNTALGEKIKNLNLNVGQESFYCDNSCQSCTVLESEGRQTVYLSANNANPNTLIASINRCTQEQFEIRPCTL